jgi:hypothetical protein
MFNELAAHPAQSPYLKMDLEESLLNRKRRRTAMYMVVGRCPHLRLIDQAQPFDRCRWLSTLLRLQVVPMGATGLEVQRVVWHNLIVCSHDPTPLVDCCFTQPGRMALVTGCRLIS